MSSIFNCDAIERYGKDISQKNNFNSMKCVQKPSNKGQQFDHQKASQKEIKQKRGQRKGSQEKNDFRASN